jgi:hypothetical protein
MRARVVVYCALGGAPLPLGAIGAGHWTNWWLAGIVLALAFVSVALFGPGSGTGQFGAVAVALLIIFALCTWSEGLLFLPTSEVRRHPFRVLIGSCAMCLIVAGVLALLAKLLNLTREPPAETGHRGLAARTAKSAA